MATSSNLGTIPNGFYKRKLGYIRRLFAKGILQGLGSASMFHLLLYAPSQVRGLSRRAAWKGQGWNQHRTHNWRLVQLLNQGLRASKGLEENVGRKFLGV